MSDLKQNTSKDYERLYDLVVNHGFEIPCRLNYSFRDGGDVVTDYAYVRKSDGKKLRVITGVRGSNYMQADEFQLTLSKSNFKSVKELFISGCKNYNLEWFDTFTEVK